MSEKNTVTIDCELTVPNGEEKVFENQYIRLETDMKCDGTLIFRNCTIEPSACIRIGINGNLEMDGCEIVHPGKNFLSGWTMTIKNTSFRLNPPYDAVIDIFGDADFDGCSFVEEKEPENSPQTSAGEFIPLCQANMKNCTFENVSGKICVAAIEKCSLTGCKDISGGQIDDSAFADCEKIDVYDGGHIRNCDFTRVSRISSVKADIDSCRFQKIQNESEDEGVIFVKKSRIIHCTFDDIELKNNSYLIDGVGDSSVVDCQFTNCRTDRADSEICRMNRTKQGGSPYVETEKSEPAGGLLKGVLKLFGSAALAVAGVGATVVRSAASGLEDDRGARLADAAGRAQDASFEKIRDMWTPDDKKDEDYYEAQAERAEFRANFAASRGSELRKQYEDAKEKCEKEKTTYKKDN